MSAGVTRVVLEIPNDRANVEGDVENLTFLASAVYHSIGADVKMKVYVDRKLREVVFDPHDSDRGKVMVL